MFISTTLNQPGLMGCYKMWKQLYLISFDLSSSIVTTDSSVFYPFECYLELVEEYSEGKIYKCEPEPRNGTVNIVYTSFTGHWGNTQFSCTEFVSMKEHAVANVCLCLNFQLRIIVFVKSILLQIIFYAYTLPVNVKIFTV